MLQSQVRSAGPFTITAAGTVVGDPMERFDGLLALSARVALAYGSGGTSIAVYLQTSLDFGATWQDVAAFNFATASLVKTRNFSKLTPRTSDVTPSDATLASGTSSDGILGDRFRWKIVSVGTYAGATTVSCHLAPS